ncbi:MAG: glycerophosphodiester phosphodiesterase [Gammaproteobacteria bacterium]
MVNEIGKYALPAVAALTLFGCRSGVPEKQGEFSAPIAKPVVVGHRGASGYRPEHTLESYALAIELGADFIESDLVLTKDGKMVTRHEPMLGATTDVASHPEFAERKTRKLIDGNEYIDWFATDFTLAEIKTLRAVQARANRDRQYDGLYEIPTLDEVIALAKRKSLETGRMIGIYPEIKHSTYHATVSDQKNQKLFGKHFFERRLLQTLHQAYGNDACAPVFIQSFEVASLQFLRLITQLKLVQLIDADDLNDDGSVSLAAPYRQPYDFVVSGDPRTFADLLTDDGLEFVKTYADAVAPWKPYLVRTVNDRVDRNGDGQITNGDRRVDGSTGVLEKAHEKGLRVHAWTFRNDAGGYGFFEPRDEMTYYYDLGVDGLFTDFPDTGVAARKASIHAGVPSTSGECKRR